MHDPTLLTFIEKSLHTHSSLPALSDYNGMTLTFGEVGAAMTRLHRLFEKNGIRKGQKIALLGKNSAHWAIVYLATVTCGAVIVPILPDFRPEEIQQIISHSEGILLFTTPGRLKEIDLSDVKGIRGVFSLTDFSLMTALDDTLLGMDLDGPHAKWPADGYRYEAPGPVHSSDTAALVYTSGTTGLSKGVILSHKSLAANVAYAMENLALKAGDPIVSFLPLAHAFGCAFEFLLPFSMGCHITFLGKIPSPSILVKAFAELRPRQILTVPLVIEKIYKSHIEPVLHRRSIRLLMVLPLFGRIIRGKIRKKLMTVFGGQFRQIIIGGAALDKTVEIFLKKINFPFTVGYGLSECGPLVSYAHWKTHKLFSVGRLVDNMAIKIVPNDKNPTAGEILVRGAHVMDGYYKNPGATAKALDAKGWFHTGDLGRIGSDGDIYIRGRSKNMILSSSGQNIYPEEIETKLNNLPRVKESLVFRENKRLVALVCPDTDSTAPDLTDIMRKNRLQLNKHLPAYCAIAEIRIHPAEFDKTPTKKIRRVHYTPANPGQARA
jgi:long-chain acyl-CoA synthetase